MDLSGGQKAGESAAATMPDTSYDSSGSGWTETTASAQTITDALPFGVVCFDVKEDGQVLIASANPMAKSIFDMQGSVVFPVALGAIWAESDLEKLSEAIRLSNSRQVSNTLEWVKTRDGHEHYLTSQLKPIFVDGNGHCQVLCTIEDHTAEKLAEQNIMHHAFHDALTGQPNRVLFRNKLEETVLNGQRSDEPFGCAVLVVNIDRFQQINESFGHSAGDRFLISMASTLRRCIGSSDILARLSGDEFAILVPDMVHIKSVVKICERIHEAMRQPYDLDGNEVFTSVSIGVASTMSSATHPEDLIRDADFAMHRAKIAGKARTEIYRRESHQVARSQFHLETELRRAVERQELQLFYQPIIDVRTSELRGFEALTRWNHKDHGYVSPVEFIQLAEETGIIVPLGRWAIEAACTCLKHWEMEVGHDKLVPINVNVSGVQFGRDDVAAVVAAALDKYKLPGNLLRIELTESSIMANPERISESLDKIRDLGVKVALDDFGTGYSSLNYLHQFPIDIIKIDRVFINQLERGNTQHKILDMIGRLARSLGHEIVAEGLEDPVHIDMVTEMGFAFGQGFYYSAPVSSFQASDMVRGKLPWSQPSP